MNWLERLSAIEAFEDVAFDRALVARLAANAETTAGRPLQLSTPSFKHYQSSEIRGCTQQRFPAFSVTGGACALNCDHCRARILEPMLPAFTPADLDRQVREFIDGQGLSGFLLSGGSNRRNEINYERFYPVIERLKRDFPALQIAVHTALLDGPAAQRMAAAGFDTAMLDIIGDERTINEVYHLDRPVADFEQSLAALTATGMAVVPHIVIGLHYGRVLGEYNALEIIARHAVEALVLVVIMPFYAEPGQFETPSPEAVAEVFLAARKSLPDQRVLLGCARPPGLHKRVTDAYAVMAGLDGIAFPADGVVAAAHAVSREVMQEDACCSIKLAQSRRRSLPDMVSA